MASPRRKFALLAALALTVAGLGTSAAVYQVQARSATLRQTYSVWYPQGSHYYRYYYYLPYVTATSYNYHYCYYYPDSYPNYYYYYNPYTSNYWGRSPVKTGGKQLYSKLEKKDQRPKLEEIPESAFPEPSTPPPIPESKDNVTMLMPPGDLPAKN